MNLKSLLRACLFAAACAILAPRAPAQQPCKPPAPPPPAAGQNIFSPQQEMDLGDAIAEHLQRNFRVVDDAELNAYLRRVGERVARQAPDVGLRFQFFLFDLPEANAFTLPGGRIYLSRKLVALARTEGEIAGVLAHEIGHGVARQMPVEMSRRFRELLGVTGVTDRRDIFDKYNQLVENVARKPSVFRRGDADKDQEVADQIGFYALVLAGYDPQAQAALWDRVTETKGKTGNFFSDLFGATKPESKRLREMLRSVAQLPPSCVEARASGSTEEFRKWQAAVVAYAGGGGREAVRGVVSKINLEPPFRVEAPEAYPAQFTPDSQSLVFHSPSLRVETWSVAEKKMTGAREMYVREGCLQTELAPDARTLACLEPSTDLTLFDVATGAQIFQKKSFFKPNFIDVLMLQLRSVLSGGQTGGGEFNFELIGMSFSPDGRYFAAGDRSVNFNGIGVSAETSAVAIDVSAPKGSLPLRDPLKRLLAGKFAFVGADRVVGVDPQDYRKSALVSFPAGEIVEQFPLNGRVEAATRGNYIVLRPIQGFAAGVMDLATKKILFANKLAAIDVYDQFFVSERSNGEVGLYRVDKTERVGVVVLPRNPLGILRARAVSPDFKWLAVSERSRGAVWDLAKGARVMHVRGFRGAHFGGDGLFYADFPKFEAMERTIAWVNLSTGGAVDGMKFAAGENAAQYGANVLVTKPVGKGGGDKGVRVEVRDALTGAGLWSREFVKEAPRLWMSETEGTLVLAWGTSSRVAKEEAKTDPRLGSRLAAMKEKEGDYFLQVLDARTGIQLGRLLVETGKGSFHIRDVEAAGDWVIVSDSENRVLAYSVSTGEQRGRFFGDGEAISKASGLLAVENERGQLTLYDLATAQKRDEFNFPAAVSFARFSDDGKRLFVLTANQTAYVINVAGDR
ncbi:MAG: M48 family metalloprotease [Acidobacteria bacterium]|nr:M48 family metalloprotease [Acidobacteriota bacterium]